LHEEIIYNQLVLTLFVLQLEMESLNQDCINLIVAKVLNETNSSEAAFEIPDLAEVNKAFYRGVLAYQKLGKWQLGLKVFRKTYRDAVVFGPAIGRWDLKRGIRAGEEVDWSGEVVRGLTDLQGIPVALEGETLEKGRDVYTLLHLGPMKEHRYTMDEKGNLLRDDGVVIENVRREISTWD
jgi:hypothetical protein